MPSRHSAMIIATPPFLVTRTAFSMVLSEQGDVIENMHFTSEWLFNRKRAMPCRARLDAPGTLHHVMIRGIEGKAIFRNNQDRKDFVGRLGTVAKQAGARILAWSLLSNHVHLLLFSGAAGLPLFMRRLLTGYAQGINRRHKRGGHLFQNRYKSIVCEEDSYLLEWVRYIYFVIPNSFSSPE